MALESHSDPKGVNPYLIPLLMSQIEGGARKIIATLIEAGDVGRVAGSHIDELSKRINRIEERLEELINERTDI